MICTKRFYLCYWWKCIDNFILECTVKYLLRYDYDHSLDLYKIVVIYVPFMKYIRKRDTIESNCPCTNSNNLEGNVKRDHSYKKQTNNTYLSISWSCADIDILRYRCLFSNEKAYASIFAVLHYPPYTLFRDISFEMNMIFPIAVRGVYSADKIECCFSIYKFLHFIIFAKIISPCICITTFNPYSFPNHFLKKRKFVPPHSSAFVVVNHILCSL